MTTQREKGRSQDEAFQAILRKLTDQREQIQHADTERRKGEREKEKKR